MGLGLHSSFKRKILRSLALFLCLVLDVQAAWVAPQELANCNNIANILYGLSSTHLTEGYREKAADLADRLQRARSELRRSPTIDDKGYLLDVRDMLVSLKRKNPSITLDEALSSMGRNNRHGFYSFLENRPRPHPPLAMAMETGEESLGVIRTHFFLNQDKSARSGTNNLDISLKLVEGHSKFMDENLDLRLLVVSSDSKEAKKILRQKFPDIFDRFVFRQVPSYVEMTFWVQDGSKPLSSLTDYLTTLNRAPYEYHHEMIDGYRQLNQLLRSRTFDLVESPVPFEGGNVIVAKEHIFIGPKVVADTMETFGLNHADALKGLEQEFGKPLIVMGHPTEEGLAQTTFHIDLSMAVANLHVGGKKRDVVIIESPDLLFQKVLGLPPLEELSEEAFKSLVKEKASTLRMLLKDPRHAADLHFLDLMEKMDYHYLLYEERKFKFLEIQARIHGYPVKRVIGLTNTKYTNANAMGVNFTNVIFSDGAVEIPRYGVPLIDEIATQFYKSLGLRVHHSDAARALMCIHGGIRCASETFR